MVKGYSDFSKGYQVCYNIVLLYYQEMLIVASTLFAIPYGLLADRYGRLSTIHLTIPGFIINGIITNSVLWFSDVFPLRGTWIAALSWTLGGGPVVAFTLIWAMIADATTETKRATVFFRFGVMSMIADFLSNTLSSALMTLNPWIPLILGNTIILPGLSLTVSLPETLDVLPPRTQAEEFNIELLNVNTFTDLRMDRIPSHPSYPLLNPACLSSLQDKLRQTIAPYSFIFTRPVLQLLSVFLIYEMSQGSSQFLVQYISTRESLHLTPACSQYPSLSVHSPILITNTSSIPITTSTKGPLSSKNKHCLPYSWNAGNQYLSIYHHINPKFNS